MMNLRECPKCGSCDVGIAQNWGYSNGDVGYSHHGYCADCDYADPDSDTEEQAVEVWNRRSG